MYDFTALGLFVDVAAATASANAANAILADIAADNKLTAVEKQSAMNEWGIINRERTSIRTQADALGISQELWDYDYVYAVLNDYITPLLQDISSTSVIDGATFRDKWSYFYEYRQRLLNKMAAVAATKADWASVTNKTGFASISQITSSNVTTYIENAALGNAQIGGNLWSTNWNYAGGTGWLLDRSGNFYGNNIYARGDIEASSLKAGTAMVQTLNIAGNAVTVPVSANGGSSCQTAAVDFGGSPVAVTFSGGAVVSTTNSSPTTGTVSAYLKRNGSGIYLLRCFTATVVNEEPGLFGSGTFTFIDYPGAGSHYYSVEILKTGGLAATTLSQQQCSVLAIGVKR